MLDNVLTQDGTCTDQFLKVLREYNPGGTDFGPPLLKVFDDLDASLDEYNHVFWYFFTDGEAEFPDSEM